MKKVSYLKKYDFEQRRIIGISSRFQIYDEGNCVSNPYKTLMEAESALKEYVLKTLGMRYSTRIEL